MLWVAAPGHRMRYVDILAGGRSCHRTRVPTFTIHAHEPQSNSQGGFPHHPLPTPPRPRRHRARNPADSTRAALGARQGAGPPLCLLAALTAAGPSSATQPSQTWSAAESLRQAQLPWKARSQAVSVRSIFLPTCKKQAKRTISSHGVSWCPPAVSANSEGDFDIQDWQLRSIT